MADVSAGGGAGIDDGERCGVVGCHREWAHRCTYTVFITYGMDA
jgi:hypothetical protein